MCVLGKQENEGELSFFNNNSLVVLKLELELHKQNTGAARNQEKRYNNKT